MYGAVRNHRNRNAPTREVRAPARALAVGAAVAGILVLALAQGGPIGASVQPQARVTPAPAPARLARTLERVLQAHPTFPGVALAVRTPALEWSGAAGVADRTSRTPLTADATFRIASLTKTFTAAAILRLVEDGKLALDDRVARHLRSSTVALLRGGGYDVDAIRVRHLLQHTSGLAGDYAELTSYVQYVVAHPRHRWTRAEQVRFVMTHGKPLSPPGAEFHYSDTGYVLLGEMLETLTGHGLAKAYRMLLDFDRLGLDETYLETLEPVPVAAEPRAHQYLGTLDTTAFDPSFDLYGAGGHVSTLDDLARFYRALHERRVFRKASTLRTMLGRPDSAGPGELPMGIDAATLGGEPCYGHAGFWGVAAYHCPRSRTTIVTNVTQAEGFIPATAELLTTVHRLVAPRSPRP